MAIPWREILLLLTLPVNALLSSEGDDALDTDIDFLTQIYNSLSAPASLSGADPASVQKKNNSSDIVFVLERPGRGTAHVTGFRLLVGFAQSFLRNVQVGGDSARVALVVSDPSRCTVWLNDIPSGELSKCGLVYKLRKLRLQPPGSLTGEKCEQDPLSSALTIASSGRPGVPKVVMVMAYGVTPGSKRASDKTAASLWNATLEQWSTRDQSHETHVYGVGVGTANMAQSRTVASPGFKHWIYLKTFRDLENLAHTLENSTRFKDNVTSEGWTSDASQSQFACAMTCDEHAQCSCSSTTGQTLCTCLPGYFGNGNQCTPCPRGTYKDQTSARRACVACPAHTGTREEGATSSDLCLPGLASDVSRNLSRCMELPHVAHAYTFGVSVLLPAGVRDSGRPCSNVAGTSCHFRCRPGFRMIGLPGLLCQWDGTWTGQLPRCVRATDSDCGSLEEIGQQDPNGFTTYVNNVPVSNILGNTNHHRNIDRRGKTRAGRRFDIDHMRGAMFGLDDPDSDTRNTDTRLGSVLRVDCPDTWALLGAVERTCSPGGVWSSTPARCVDVRCPPVPMTQGLIVSPSSCSDTWQAHGASCWLSCQAGYRLVGLANLTCADRRWTSIDKGSDTSQVFGVCFDVEPPSISCRANVTVLSSSATQKFLTWDEVAPTVTDSSGHVTLTSPDVVSSPFPVYFGHQTIRFQASDKYHTVSCTFGITLKDPDVRVLECPAGESIVYTPRVVYGLVLPPVRFALLRGGSDPEPVGHRCSPANHTVERSGHHQVVCWAVSPQGPLGAECRFSVNIQRKTCPVPPPPAHGHLSCSPTNTSRLACSVSCDPGYGFYEPPEQPYLCGEDGRWQNVRLWPDCSSSYDRLEAMKDVSYSLSQVFSNASDCLARKLSVKAQVERIIQSVLDVECGGSDTCSLELLNVTCFPDENNDQGDPDSVFEVYRPSLNYTIKADSKLHTFQHKLDLLEVVSEDVTPLIQNFTQMRGKSSHQNRIIGVDCVLGYQTLADNLCVACPPGTYWNGEMARCHFCQMGHYQPSQAQTSCIVCPNSTFTESIGAKDISQCAGGCPVGHWSPSGLAPCRPCPIGQYQPLEEATVCLNCPHNHTTESVGTVEIADCYEECEPGTAGWSGQKPFCEPCPIDTYQPLRGQEDCKPRGHVYGPGSGWCNGTSFLCYNGGECVDPPDLSLGVSCQCPPGYTGPSCELLDPHYCPHPFVCPASSLTGQGPDGQVPSKLWQYENPCESGPCHDGSSCVNRNDTDSYQCYCPLGRTGPLCEVLTLLCRGQPCVHGECDGGVCVCDTGYAGGHCDTPVDPCWFGLETEGCTPGDRRDPCLSQPCLMGSTCFMKIDGSYVCKCQPGKTGPHCSREISLDLDLEYDLDPRLGWDVTLPAEFMPSLTAMTLCLWLRPSPVTSYFTIVTFDHSDVIETTFVNRDLSYPVFGLKQTEQLNIEFFRETIKTGVVIPLAVWTHLCFTWAKLDGSWQVFLNGTLTRSGKSQQLEQPIPQSTFVTVAPRNTTLSDWEIFLGRISQFNIFSEVLPVPRIQVLANQSACSQGYHGDVISSTNVLPYAFRTKKSLCLDVNECWFPTEFPCLPPSDICVDTLDSYQCTTPGSSHKDMKYWLETVGIATAAFVVLSLLVTVVFIRRRRRRNRERGRPQPDVQMRQGTSSPGQANRHTGGNNRNPIVRSPARQSGRRGIFRRHQPADYTKGTILTADGLEETVIFDQAGVSAGEEAGPSNHDRSSEAGDLDRIGNGDSQMPGQDFVMNDHYVSRTTGQTRDHTRQMQDISRAQHSMGDEPDSLTFRTADSRKPNRLDFFRLKLPSLRFSRQKASSSVGYSHLQEESWLPGHVTEWDATVEEGGAAAEAAVDDTYLAGSRDGAPETDTDNDNIHQQ